MTSHPELTIETHRVELKYGQNKLEIVLSPISEDKPHKHFLQPASFRWVTEPPGAFGTSRVLVVARTTDCDIKLKSRESDVVLDSKAYGRMRVPDCDDRRIMRQFTGEVPARVGLDAGLTEYYISLSLVVGEVNKDLEKLAQYKEYMSAQSNVDGLFAKLKENR